MRYPFLRLAVQNLARRPGRTLIQALAVAVAVGSGFAAVVARRAVLESSNFGFGRLGADLLVTPGDSLVNLTPAILSVEPSGHSLAPGILERVRGIPGVAVAAPQRYFAVPLPSGGHAHDCDLFAFDPAHDFTVLAWAKDTPTEPLGPDRVLVGARRPETVGQTVTLGRRSVSVVGRLGPTGVGPPDRAFFATFEAADAIAGTSDGRSRPTGILIRLAPDAGPEQVRFALAAFPDLKVTASLPMVTSVRRTLAAILGGAVLLTIATLAATVLQLGALYTAVLAERRQELGVLRTLGTRPMQAFRMVLFEAAITTALGGVAGLLLGVTFLIALERTLGTHLESLGVLFEWPAPDWIAAVAVACIATAVAVGPVGAALPAWRACRRDAYDLARGEIA